MKVFELMNLLGKLPANHDVLVVEDYNNENCYVETAISINDGDVEEAVIIVGDGQSRVQDQPTDAE